MKSFSLILLLSSIAFSISQKCIFLPSQSSQFRFIFNSFIEIQFTNHVIHSFKVYNFMSLRIFTNSSSITTISWQRLITPIWSPFPSVITPRPSPPSPMQPLIYFLSLWICLFWTSYKWNHTICGLLWLTSFTKHDVFKVLPVNLSIFLNVGLF